MTTTNNAGLDYSLGRSNFDTSNGIHFGVIAQNSINLDILSEFESEYGDPHCPECGAEIQHSSDVEPDAEWNTGKDYACPTCKECYWSDACFPDESLGISYHANGYLITDCLDTDLVITKSPYFTFAQFCSPCVPGAGNLDSPMDAPDTGAKCYALGHDWFDGDIAPYTVYSVATGEVVKPTVEAA
jgi:hypothetical protein